MAQDRRGIDRDRLTSLHRQEADRFAERTPKSRELYRRGRKLMPHGVPQAWMAGFYPDTPIYVREGSGACFIDVDGNSYLDMSQCDLSMSCGYGPPAVCEAVARQTVVARNISFLSELSNILAQGCSQTPINHGIARGFSQERKCARCARITLNDVDLVIHHGHLHIEETFAFRMHGDFFCDAGHFVDFSGRQTKGWDYAG